MSTKGLSEDLSEGESDQSSVEELQKQIKKLEKRNRLLEKKLHRSENSREVLESFFDEQTKVFNRTIQGLEASKAEAEEQRQELQAAFNDLQMMQAKLVESEKMSALGVLVAGVAHEINNPINFIHANIMHADDYVHNLLALINLYQKIYPSPDSKIVNFIEEQDLEFVSEDIGQLISSMKVGSDRIRNIVLGLRNFSRLDEAEYKAADLHEGLESTLMILEHRLKANAKRDAIEVTRDYGQLPKISCFAGQINQVFMNILGNAIDAIEEQLERSQPPDVPPSDPLFLTDQTHQTDQTGPDLCPDCYSGKINIHTAILEPSEQVAITISDNGAGIEENAQKKIFDPFFTTKPVGSGTGLGMSISYKIIVENHKGSLTYHSEPGCGTTFVIHIPLQQAN